MKGLTHLPDWGLRVEPENIPQVLKNTNRWVVWKALENQKGRVLKMPFTIEGRIAQTNNPQHRTSFENALRAYDDHLGYNGIGFVLTGMKQKVTVLDLDKCFDGRDNLVDWAHRILIEANTYCEFSPSGNGARAFLTGDAGEFVKPKLGVECYTQDSGRYLTVTGQHIRGFPTIISPVTDELLDILNEYRPDARDNERTVEPVTDLSDQELREILKEIPNAKYESYDEWLKLGMAIHHQWSGDPQAMELWDELSLRTSSYDREELESTWDSFSLGGQRQVTIRSWFPERKTTAHADQDWPDLGDEETPVAHEVVDEGGAEPEVEGVDGRPGRVDDYAELGLEDADQAVDAEVPDEILEDWLAKKEVSAWAGQPGAMKTMSLLDLAVCMTKEYEEYGEWLGQLVKPGPVLWFAYEGIGAIRKRLRAYRTKAPVPARLVLVSPKKDLHKDGWQEYAFKIVQAVTARHGRRPQLIVVDTLAAATPGMKEKDEEDMGIVARRLRKMAEGVRAHVAVIHHSTKDGSSDLRGSGLLAGDMDTIIRMESRGGVLPGVDIEVRKQRNLGSIGEVREGRLEVVKTGLETTFGKDETAPMLRYVDMTEAGGSPEVMDLEQRVQAALMEGQLDLLMGDDVLHIRAEWLGKHYPTAAERTQKRRWMGACEDLKEQGYEVKKGAKGIKSIRPYARGQSQGFDESDDNWGGF